MPTYYFEDTDAIAEAIVKENKIEHVANYINENFNDPIFGDFIQKVNSEENMCEEKENSIPRIGVLTPPWALRRDETEQMGSQNRIIFLTVSAIDHDNYVVLEKIKENILLTKRTDGNAYTPLEVAWQRMLESHGSDKSKKMLEYLISISREDISDHLGNCGRSILKDEMDDIKKQHEYIEFLVQHHASLQDIFHYSIAWDHPEMTEYLMTNYRYKMEVKGWIRSAYEIARRFESEKAIEYVTNHPELKKYIR